MGAGKLSKDLYSPHVIISGVPLSKYDWSGNLDYVIKRSEQFDAFIEQSKRVADQLKEKNDSASIDRVRKLGSRIGNTYRALDFYRGLIVSSTLLGDLEPAERGTFLERIADWSRAAQTVLDKLKDDNEGRLTDQEIVDYLISRTQECIQGHTDDIRAGRLLRMGQNAVGLAMGLHGLGSGISSLSRGFMSRGGSVFVPAGSRGMMNLATGAISIEVDAGAVARVLAGGTQVMMTAGNAGSQSADPGSQGKQGTSQAPATEAGEIPRARVIGVPESSDVVTLWKAPAKGRTGMVDEVKNGFDPAKYPGDGPYLATDRALAEDFLRGWGNGLQEINIPRSKFNELVHKGVIKVDGYYEAGRSWHVPAEKLAEFNEVVKQGTTNRYHP